MAYRVNTIVTGSRTQNPALSIQSFHACMFTMLAVITGPTATSLGIIFISIRRTTEVRQAPHNAKDCLTLYVTMTAFHRTVISTLMFPRIKPANYHLQLGMCLATKRLRTGDIAFVTKNGTFLHCLAHSD